VTIDRYKKPKDSRIVRPKSSQNNSTKGTVVAIADNITDIQVGDKILYSQFAGYLLVFEGFPFLRTLGREEVLAILKNDAPDLIIGGAA
jgi:co-chaperonin GroES (HSP10)